MPGRDQAIPQVQDGAVSCPRFGAALLLEAVQGKAGSGAASGRVLGQRSSAGLVCCSVHAVPPPDTRGYPLQCQRTTVRAFTSLALGMTMPHRNLMALQSLEELGFKEGEGAYERKKVDVPKQPTREQTGFIAGLYVNQPRPKSGS